MELLLTDIDDRTEEALLQRAKQHGRTPEAEACELLSKALLDGAASDEPLTGREVLDRIERILEETGAEFPPIEEFKGGFGLRPFDPI